MLKLKVLLLLLKKEKLYFSFKKLLNYVKYNFNKKYLKCSRIKVIYYLNYFIFYNLALKTYKNKSIFNRSKQFSFMQQSR